MSDIVDGLRGRADRYRQLWGNAAYYTEGNALFDEKAAARIEQLEAEVLTWQGHAKTAIWGDSEECKSLSAEVDRLVRSRNKWGQRYNKLLLKIRAGENGETDDPASWQLRMALDDANVKNDEAAARIEQLEAALRIAQRGLDPYASYEAQLDARVVVDGICAALAAPSGAMEKRT